jgi:chemotaxis protein MotB
LFPPGSKSPVVTQSQNAASREMLEKSISRRVSEGGVGAKRGGAAKNKEILSGDKAMLQLKSGIEALVGTGFMKGMVRAHLEKRGLVISLGEAGLFDSGSDQIKPDGKTLLDTVAMGLVSIGNYIRVEGHTDNVPISNFRFPSNWDLSTARATAMVTYLVSHSDLDPELMSAAGYGEFRPAEPNETEEGRAHNRRVDIVVLNPSAAETEPRRFTSFPRAITD